MSPDYEAELDARLQALDMLVATCLQRLFPLEDLEELRSSSAEYERQRSVAAPLPPLATATVFKHHRRLLDDAIRLAKSDTGWPAQG
jgi:hypothetical protein